MKIKPNYQGPIGIVKVRANTDRKRYRQEIREFKGSVKK